MFLLRRLGFSWLSCRVMFLGSCMYIRRHCPCLIYDLDVQSCSNTMCEALSNASDMIQPALLIIGNDYFIIIDQLFMKTENAILE
jgi:hypothetical protein